MAYSLRAEGGNHFAWHAGNRGDYLVVRDPEFNLGRVGSSNGVGGCWDTSRVPTARQKSQVMSRLAEGAARNLKSRVAPEALGTLKERALTRSLSSPSQLAANRRRPVLSAEQGVEQFLQELLHPSSLPSSVHREGSSTCIIRHWREVRAQMSALRERALKDPQGVREELLRTGSWKYWSDAIQEMRRRRAWGDDIEDGRGRGKMGKGGVGKWKYVYPESALPYMKPPRSP
mmetsp:Transcript_63049/g.133083  ORF Transcript_63049/g.133083 Transcript_63049/m.133083 type:complete len:231 (-) Transcript_63049:288-980(-)|eukprot:CAMPEP_0206489478 /NCGR_PEP_ID=MMETSP0324_2-20121206/43273_1 /ASSEMBLY_ACC=CAM_ASM_000836 /TAXON_ID=2866 /ORGANISM="Crypthecodinium cohnii, Strain Seligo" /LENGTH=230 /DNA_ID=CAMNT_0053969183 /DNA_START=32 /DNA_END=724 /DNA_ORIENTATION=+